MKEHVVRASLLLSSREPSAASQYVPTTIKLHIYFHFVNDECIRFQTDMDYPLAINEITNCMSSRQHEHCGVGSLPRNRPESNVTKLTYQVPNRLVCIYASETCIFPDHTRFTCLPRSNFSQPGCQPGPLIRLTPTGAQRHDLGVRCAHASRLRGHPSTQPMDRSSTSGLPKLRYPKHDTRPQIPRPRLHVPPLPSQTA
ncbi:hypothetical protein BU23DRAFT_143586 [Bimuria novae-zelandiae CBS 107.79]|uniref:Uncharacterized protein n=1 Tax=Bimuria novae-zelandiae CBS 107.79 TaxID=1447943 RepID=A0A6A5V6H4_9PLEO|nr:hypothetical protein BU23DRAFT_143586 [Bimuria novae-zelandiae CBS 107.79]